MSTTTTNEQKDISEVDKLKLLEFAGKLRKIKAPECKTQHLKYYAGGIVVSLNDLADIIEKEIGEL